MGRELISTIPAAAATVLGEVTARSGPRRAPSVFLSRGSGCFGGQRVGLIRFVLRPVRGVRVLGDRVIRRPTAAALSPPTNRSAATC
jgi:hypothetical protein